MEALQTKQYHLKWDRCTDLPRRMYGASVAVDDNNVYVTAGSAPENETYNNVYNYDILTDHWNTLPPPGHCNGILCMVDNKLSIFGGDDPVTDDCINKVSTYNSNSNNWASDYPNVLQKRALPGVVTHGDHVIVMGGEYECDKYHDNIEVMSWRRRSPWREVLTKLPIPMFAFTPTIAGKHLLIVGYGAAEGRRDRSHRLPIATVTSSDQVASHWEGISPAPYGVTATVPYSNPPLIIGGCGPSSQGGVPTSDISLYDTSKKSWVKVDSLTTARSDVGAATINSNTFIIAGGYTKGESGEAAMASSLPIVEIGHIVRN